MKVVVQGWDDHEVSLRRWSASFVKSDSCGKLRVERSALAYLPSALTSTWKAVSVYHKIMTAYENGFELQSAICSICNVRIKFTDNNDTTLVYYATLHRVTATVARCTKTVCPFISPSVRHVLPVFSK